MLNAANAMFVCERLICGLLAVHEKERGSCAASLQQEQLAVGCAVRDPHSDGSKALLPWFSESCELSAKLAALAMESKNHA